MNRQSKETKQINPDEIIPSVWSTYVAEKSEWANYLVDDRRFVRSKDIPPIDFSAPLLPGAVEFHPIATCEELHHPVAISLTSPVAIFYGLWGCRPGEDRRWWVSEVDKFGMTRRAASCALSEAWRGITACDHSHPPGKWMEVSARQPIACLAIGDKLKPQEATMLRNVVAWIHWEHWNRKGASIAKRAAELSSWGYPTTPKALAKAAEERGL